MTKEQLQRDLNRAKDTINGQAGRIAELERQIKADANYTKVTSWRYKELEDAEKLSQKQTYEVEWMTKKLADYANTINEQSKTIFRLVNKIIP